MMKHLSANSESRRLIRLGLWETSLIENGQSSMKVKRVYDSILKYYITITWHPWFDHRTYGYNIFLD